MHSFIIIQSCTPGSINRSNTDSLGATSIFLAEQLPYSLWLLTERVRPDPLGMLRDRDRVRLEGVPSGSGSDIFVFCRFGLRFFVTFPSASTHLTFFRGADSGDALRSQTSYSPSAVSMKAEIVAKLRRSVVLALIGESFLRSLLGNKSLNGRASSPGMALRLYREMSSRPSSSEWSTHRPPFY